MKKYSVFLCVILVTFLFACDSNQTKEEIPVESSITMENEVITTESSIQEEIDGVLSTFTDLSQLYSFTVTQNGESIVEKYFNNADKETRNNIFSDTKSVTSLLVGIAIDEGYIESVEQSIGDFIDLSTYDNAEELARIKIKDLLTMRAGLIWNSNDLSSEYHGLKYAKDPLELILTRNMSFAPGTRFNYSDGAAHLTSIIFTKATGQSLLDYGNSHLFGPLGIENVVWNEDVDGNNYGGFDLFLTASDMLKIGQLVLNEGMFNEDQLVSKQWILDSTSKQAYSDGGSPDNNEYGYYWWLGEKEKIDLIAAYGHGGQFIYIIKDLNLVITASCYGAVSDGLAAEHFTRLHQSIVHEIIPLFID